MTRQASIAAAFLLSACASVQITSADLQRIADQIMAVKKGSEGAYCALPPNAQAKVLAILRKSFPDAQIACQSVAGGAVVSGVRGWER